MEENLNRGSRWKEGGLLLGLVRGLALALALLLICLFSNKLVGQPLYYVVVFALSMYTITKIAYPFYWVRGKGTAYAFLIVDVFICCGILFINGGWDNSFILFPLTVILSSAIYFPQKTTYIVAAIGSMSAVGSEFYAISAQGSGLAMPVQLYIALMAIYVIVAFLIAWLPYVANINITATIKHRAILEERSRLSRELHDGPAQRLAALMLKLDSINLVLADGSDYSSIIPQLVDFKKQLLETHLEVREVIDQLRIIRMPENPAILPTLAQYTREFSQDTGIPCHVFLSDGYLNLSPLATVELLRVVQEALTNIRKHSGANQAEVRFESMDNLHMVKITIKDDGVGFNYILADHKHGLSVMKERVQSLGGNFEIKSSPGKGTEILVTVPVNSKVGGYVG